jgi:energy-converting hydrogenase Eha subunit A
MAIQLTHFSAALVFSFFVSIVFGITQKNTKEEMVRYGLYCFALFVIGIIAAGWAMALLRYLAGR